VYRTTPSKGSYRTNQAVGGDWHLRDASRSGAARRRPGRTARSDPFVRGFTNSPWTGGRRHFTHSKVMAWVALDRTVRDAERFKLQAPLERWRQVRDRMQATICAQGFDSSRNTFTQSFGGDELDASLLLMPIVGFLPPDDPRVRGTVAVFLPCSFWLADNYTLQNRDAEARALFERLLSLRNDVGLLAEEYDPQARRQVGASPKRFRISLSSEWL
jgi:GH15 family glucan-1,4-alpha-glucosidase